MPSATCSSLSAAVQAVQANTAAATKAITTGTKTRPKGTLPSSGGKKAKDDSHKENMDVDGNALDNPAFVGTLNVNDSDMTEDPKQQNKPPPKDDDFDDVIVFSDDEADPTEEATKTNLSNIEPTDQIRKI